MAVDRVVGTTNIGISITRIFKKWYIWYQKHDGYTDTCIPLIRIPLGDKDYVSKYMLCRHAKHITIWSHIHSSNSNINGRKCGSIPLEHWCIDVYHIISYSDHFSVTGYI